MAASGLPSSLHMCSPFYRSIYSWAWTHCRSDINSSTNCKYALRIYSGHLPFKKTNVNKALKQICIGAVDELFVKYLRNIYVGYGTKIRRKYSPTTYRDISVGELHRNDVAMKRPYNINQPIEALFK